MSFDFNLLNSLFLINILSLPSKGVLLLDGKEVRIGTKISKYDIQNNRFSYQHKTDINPLNTSEEDMFTFCLWNNKIGNITSNDYPACISSEIVIPLDGVYTFKFTIQQTISFNLNFVDTIKMFENEFYTLQPNDIDINFNSNIIPITFNVSPVTMDFYVRSKKTNNFTYSDVLNNQVKIKKFLPENETLKIFACSNNNVCKNDDILFQTTNELEQIGNNVIYARAGQTIAWSFFANKDEILWEIENGEIQNLVTLTDRNIIQWSSFSNSSNLPISDPNRGPGYDKLQKYQNVQEEFYKTDKLPEGLLFSNLGYITFVLREPPSFSGSQPWYLNNSEQMYDFNLTAIDPVTDKKITRKYRLIVNFNGTNINGLTSETLVL